MLKTLKIRSTVSSADLLLIEDVPLSVARQIRKMLTGSYFTKGELKAADRTVNSSITDALIGGGSLRGTDSDRMFRQAGHDSLLRERLVVHFAVKQNLR